MDAQTQFDPTSLSKPVRSGVTPYLAVDGALKAVDFYRQAFGAEVAAVMPADETGRTMHAHLYINGGSLMLSDAYPEHGHPWQPPQGFTLHLQVTGIDAWWDRAVAAGAQVVMPVELMFWGDRFGQLRDPFGVTWSLGETPAG